MSSKEIQKIAKDYKEALIKNNIPVNAIFLFGSYAHGKQRKGSDIDFCVISKSFGKDDFGEMVRINQIAKRVAVEIEAFPVSEKEYRSLSNPFIAEAVKTGFKII